MDIRVLQYFLAVARAQNISAAAAALHVTQPTLSRQLLALEETLGTTLFLRGSRKITLTEEGLLLQKRAEEILDLVQKTEIELQAEKGEIGGDIYIGGGETQGMALVAKVVQTLHRAHPSLRFHLYSGNGDDVGERLNKGLLDFGVLIEPANLTKYNSLRLPVQDTWGLLMRGDSPLATKSGISPQDLNDIPLITSRQRFVAGQLANWLQKDYAELNVVATYNLLYNTTLLVQQGLGYALCLDKLANTSSASGLCFRPLAPPLKAGLHLVWKKEGALSRAAGLFLQGMREALA